MTPTLRVAQLADAELLAWLGANTFRETFGHLYPPEDLARFLEESHAPAAWSRVLAETRTGTWIAESSEGPIGYAVAGACTLPHPEVTPSSGELKRLYVDRSAQGAGIGRLLLNEALGWLETRGLDPIWIGVYSQNHRAIRLYEGRGFRRVGEYEFRVGGSRDRELILRRDSPQRYTLGR